jgi:hypothetical protein
MRENRGKATCSFNLPQIWRKRKEKTKKKGKKKR